MDWFIPFATVLGVFIANAALILPLFLWNRAESRADIRHMDAKLDSNRELVRAIHDEIKDFHYRLIDIEKNKENKK
jgi:hypothetical protein